MKKEWWGLGFILVLGFGTSHLTSLSLNLKVWCTQKVFNKYLSRERKDERGREKGKKGEMKGEKEKKMEGGRGEGRKNGIRKSSLLYSPHFVLSFFLHCFNSKCFRYFHTMPNTKQVINKLMKT